MPQISLFNWRDGDGWLILSGGGEPGSDVETLALNKVHPGLTMAYIFAASDVETADRHLTALEDAGAPAGFLIDVVSEDDQTIADLLKNIGLAVIGDGPKIGGLKGALTGVTITGLETAFEEGACILGIGTGAAVWGDYYVNEKDEVRPGFGWLSKAIILPPDSQINDKALLEQYPDCFVIALGEESALAFGPNGEVERWGEAGTRFTLGKTYVTGNSGKDND